MMFPEPKEIALYCKEVKKGAEPIRTEFDMTTGEILVELGGHKYPIDSEFSYGCGESANMHGLARTRDCHKTIYSSYQGVKTEPRDTDRTAPVQLQVPKFRPTGNKNLTLNVKCEPSYKHDCSVQSQYPSEQLLQRTDSYDPAEHSNEAVQRERSDSYESANSYDPSNLYHRQYVSDTMCNLNTSVFQLNPHYNEPYSRKTETDTSSIPSTDYPEFSMNYQMTEHQPSSAYHVQDDTTQYASSAYYSSTSGFSNVSLSLSQTTHNMAFRPPAWPSERQGFEAPSQFDLQTSDCRRHIRKLKRGCRLWEFIRNLLLDPASNPSLIRWENREEGTFKLVQSKTIAYMWGMKKGNRGMTYEKLSRAMRYYYKRQVFAPVLGKRLVYKFGPRAVGWKE